MSKTPAKTATRSSDSEADTAKKPSARGAAAKSAAPRPAAAPMASTASFNDRFSPAPPPARPEPEPMNAVKTATKADPKLANAWKTKAGGELTEAELLAMPDSEYMNDKQLEFFRTKLQALKDDLLSNAGQTTGPLDIERTWDAITDDHVGLMDHLGIKKFMVLGYCIGQPLIWNLIKRIGDRVVAAVLTPAQTGLAGFHGTIRTEVRYTAGGQKGVQVFDVIYSPSVPAGTPCRSTVAETLSPMRRSI